MGMMNPKGELHRWDMWWWVEEWMLGGLVMVLVSLPALAFGAELALALWRKQWAKAGGCVLLSVLGGVLTAVIFLVSNRSDLFPNTPYAMDGWYLVWLAGAYLAGIVSLLLGIGRWWKARMRTARLRSANLAPA